MHADMLPPELHRRWSHLVYVRKHGDEWSAECPRCGDEGHGGRDFPDRFRMWLNPARGWCRTCGYQDFADSDKPTAITPEMRRQWIEERVKREEQARAEIEHALELLRRESAWMHYHEQLDQFSREWWHQKGVPDYLIETLFLGYCPCRTVWTGQFEWSTPTATIPVFEPGWQLVNIRHRLINPPTPDDKYRPDRAGLKSAMYLTNPDEKPAGEVVLVEGEVKAIVVYDRLQTMTVVGIPGKAPRADMLSILDECDRVHIVLDPDADKQSSELAKLIGPKRARVVRLPVKPDDFFTMYGGSKDEFLSALRYGAVKA